MCETHSDARILDLEILFPRHATTLHVLLFHLAAGLPTCFWPVFAAKRTTRQMMRKIIREQIPLSLQVFFLQPPVASSSPVRQRLGSVPASSWKTCCVFVWVWERFGIQVAGSNYEIVYSTLAICCAASLFAFLVAQDEVTAAALQDHA